MNIIRTLCIALLCVSMAGCAQLSKFKTVEEKEPTNTPTLAEHILPPPPIENVTLSQLLTPQPIAEPEEEVEEDDGRRFTFRAKDLPIKDAISLFANLYDMNIITSPALEGNITVDFRDLPLKQAMTAILSAYDYTWEEQKGLIMVSEMGSRSYEIDYIRLVRGGSGTSQSSISSQSGSGGGDGSTVSSSATTSSRISQHDDIKFWQELEEQLKVLLSEKGKLAVNRLSGIIQVSDKASHLEQIDQYVKSLKQAIHRQVEIYVKIIEVSLRDDTSLGIDWAKVTANARTLLTTHTIPSGAIGGLSLKPPTFVATNVSSSVGAVLEALEEQGDIKVISQPKIRSLNNQTAMIKVGTDLTFFTKTANTTVSNGVSETVISEEPTTVTEGLVMSVTPQISKDGWIMLDIAPIITRVIDTIVSSNESTAPVLDIKQASALVRARNGEMIVLGGLIQQQNARTKREVTGLGQVPLIGGLFRGRYQADNTKEIVILLQPQIVN